jgi:hypothetical protein
VTRASDRLRAARAGEHEDLCPHGLKVCRKCIIVEDSGKRMSDTVNLIIAGHSWDTIVHSWVAISLETGGYDGTLYDSREAAVAHQSDARYWFYLCLRNTQGGIKPLDAQLLINSQRSIYEAGGRMVEPKAPSLIPTINAYDRFNNRVR